MLRTRVITAVVLFAILLVAVSLGNHVLSAAMAAALGIVLFEWLSMTHMRKPVAALVSAACGALAVCYALLDMHPEGIWFLGLELVACVVWLGLLAVTYVARDRGFAVTDNTSYVLAALIVSATFFAMVWLIQTGGWQLMLSVFMLVWLADVCAYFAGRFFGKHKMAPAISPKKTWEGAAGAFVSVVICALAAWVWLPHEMVFSSLLMEKAGFAAGILIVLLLVAISISGDLFESALKRHAGIKDSGKLLPGHGGFYDRLDSALAVFPCATAALLVM